MGRKLVITFVTLLAAGLLRTPFERRYVEELTQRGIMSPEISLGTLNDLTQSSLAGVLGGLRSVMASRKHIEAFQAFENKDWYRLKKDYQTCTALDPHNIYYWQSGGWHLAYNAAADVRDNQALKAVQRRVLEKEYLEQGDEFFRKGIVVNPQSAVLWSEIGRLWSSPFKRPDYQRSAAAWEKASELSANQIYRRSYLYALSRVKGAEEKAREVVLGLAKEDPKNLKIPTFVALYWVLNHAPNVPDDEHPKLLDIFSNYTEAYQILHNYKLRVEREKFPAWGVDQALKSILQKIRVPDRYNSFKSKRPRVITGRGWNEE